jgi:hypothetical protein
VRSAKPDEAFSRVWHRYIFPPALVLLARRGGIPLGAEESIATKGLCGHLPSCPHGVGQSARANLLHEIFSPRKRKNRIFFAAKIFAGPGDPDFFVKNRNCRKIHTEEKFCQLVVHPVSG